MEKFKSEFEKVSTMDLAVFFNKLDTLVKDCHKVIMKLDALAEVKGYNNPTLPEKRMVLVKKANEAMAKANRITLEIELRMKKKIGFVCDYPMISRHAHFIDEEYERVFLKANEGKKETESEMKIVDK